jgi:hypothetical protein
MQRPPFRGVVRHTRAVGFACRTRLFRAGRQRLESNRMAGVQPIRYEKVGQAPHAYRCSRSLHSRFRANPPFSSGGSLLGRLIHAIPTDSFYPPRLVSTTHYACPSITQAIGWLSGMVQKRGQAPRRNALFFGICRVLARSQSPFLNHAGIRSPELKPLCYAVSVSSRLGRQRVWLPSRAIFSSLRSIRAVESEQPLEFFIQP